MTESSPYGARHFLRKLDAESASELRRRPALLRDGTEVPKGGYEDIDQFGLDGLLIYRTLVLVHSPSASRPPSLYQRVWSGRYYEVWQRPETPSTRVLEHLPLGDALQPAAVPPCGAVQRLGRLAAADHGHLAAVARPAVTVVDLASGGLPSTWAAYNDIPGVVYPALRARFRPPSAFQLQAATNSGLPGRSGEGSSCRSMVGGWRRRKTISIIPGVDTPFGQLPSRRGATA